MSKSKRLRAALGFTRTSNSDVWSRGGAVLNGVGGNPVFAHPPVDLAVLKAKLDEYAAAIAEALDGGKKAIAARDVIREEVIIMMEQLGHYVEIICKDDIATFLSSGFDVVSTSRVAPGPLVQPIIRKIDYGNVSGQLLVSLTPVPNALVYYLRYATLGDGAPDPGSWTTITLTTGRPAVSITGLTPGTIYAFQVQAVGKSGLTDWSDSGTCMCT